jgi:hypothetical protein
LANVLELLNGGKFQLLGVVRVYLRMLDFPLCSALGPVFPVSESDAAVSEFEEEFLHHVLQLLDVDEQGALLLHPKLDFGSDLAANGLISSNNRASG